MNLIINGKATQTIDDHPSVRDLVKDLGLVDRAVAVEVNRQLVPRLQHGDTQLNDGDVVEIVTLVGGG